MKRKKMMKKMMLSPQRRGNVTSVVASQKKPLDKKAALKSKIQDILSGRSRFVIRKEPSGSNKGKKSDGDDWAASKVHSHPSPSRNNEEVEKDRCWLFSRHANHFLTPDKCLCVFSEH